jgi:hypothetical protein
VGGLIPKLKIDLDIPIPAVRKHYRKQRGHAKLNLKIKNVGNYQGSLTKKRSKSDIKMIASMNKGLYKYNKEAIAFNKTLDVYKTHPDLVKQVQISGGHGTFKR